MLATYRVRESDTNSIVDPQGVALFELPQTTVSPFWDFASWAPDIKTHEYKTAFRTRTGLTVTVNGAVATDGDTIAFDDTTPVGQSFVVYDPATKQTVTLGAPTNSTTFNIRTVVPQSGASRAIIADNAVLDVLSIAEDYHEINAVQNYEQTTEETNYIQDLTIQLPFHRADLEEIREWGVDRQMLVTETMNRHLRQLDKNLIYGTPKKNDGTHNGQTGGFDYFVRKAGNNYSKASTNDELADLEAGLYSLVEKGMDQSDGVAMMGSLKAYRYFNAKGLATFSTTTTPGAGYTYGNVMRGLEINGLGFVPFMVNVNLRDNHVRIGSQTTVQKAYFNGDGEAGQQAVLRLVDEPGLSTSKKPVSTLQMKHGAVIDAEKCSLYETAIS